MSKNNRSQHILLITNPGSGDAEEIAAKVKKITGNLENDGLKVDVVWTKPKEKATPAARRAVRKGYKVIVAMGGDGTIEAVMRGMIGSKARLGIIPSGTENNIAKSLGIPTDLDQACALIASGSTHKLDIGQVKTKKGKKFNFFEMATVGLSAAIYPDTNKVAHGKLSRIGDTALTFFQQETRPKVSLTFNNESKYKVETMLVMVSNTPIFGKNFNVAPEASLQDGLLDISVYPDFSKAELLKYYAEIMDGGYSGDKKVQYYQVRKLKIKSSPKLDVMADGVALGKGKVTIKLLQGALRVFTNLDRRDAESQGGNGAERKPETAQQVEKNKPHEDVAIKVG